MRDTAGEVGWGQIMQGPRGCTEEADVYLDCDKELLEAFGSDVSVFLPDRFSH